MSIVSLRLLHVFPKPSSTRILGLDDTRLSGQGSHRIPLPMLSRKEGKHSLSIFRMSFFHFWAKTTSSVISLREKLLAMSKSGHTHQLTCSQPGKQ